MDSELLAKCRAGDPQAIETLVNEYQGKVFRLCLSILDSQEDAQDAAQETFIAALKALQGYRGEAALQTWLFSIAINTCRGQLRQLKRKTRLQENLIDPAMTEDQSRQTPERQVMEAQRTQAIWRAISGLDEKHRLPIVLRYYHELSTQEIADVLGLNIGTVHSRLSNARTRLTGELKRANIAPTGRVRDSQ
ncbi:MAG: RNA polymerase sigma factor [Anaerolineales bacterium]